jgi:glycosyltransferase involved in cell wall biosynthesis
MKLLHVISSLEIGGAERLLLDLVKRQIEDGLDVYVHVFRKTESFLELDLLNLNCKVTFGVAGQYNPVQLFYLRRFVSIIKPDIIHAHLTSAQIWTSLIQNCRRVTTEHNTHNRRRRWFFRIFDYLLYSRFHQVACISEATRAALIAWIPKVQSKTTIIHNGIDISRFNPSSRISKPVRKIIMVARFEEQKDQDTLINSLTKFKELELILVGDGARRDELENLVKIKQIDKRVHFFGKRNDIPSLLNDADVYVHSVHWEGFGIAVVEAMAAGLPVIVSNVPGLRDVVGEAGLLFDPGNVEQLALCIKKMIEDDQLRNMKMTESRTRASEFSIEKTVEAYHFFYRSSLEGRA